MLVYSRRKSSFTLITTVSWFRDVLKKMGRIFVIKGFGV